MRRGCLGFGAWVALTFSVLCAAGVQLTRMPGVASRDLDDLHPPFRERVDRVLASLEAQGFAPHVRETWRDRERQAYYRDRGWSRTGFGFHNTTATDGAPDALAVDLGHAGLDPKRRDDVPALAAFYKALLRAALVEGLTTGGTWSRRNPVWAEYDLGWGPGHVQPAALTLADARRGQRFAP